MDDIVAAYLKAAEVGEAPDRAQWLARYPDLARQLAEFFDDQDQFDRLTARLGVFQKRLMSNSAESDTPVHSIQETAGLAPTGVFRSFGDYELLELVGKGGMGVVYKARQKSLNRLVALKMIRASSLASPADLQRFHAEAEAAASLDHPHIVPIHEVGELDGQPFFSMKLITGGSLAEQLSAFLKDPRSAAQLLCTIARAVHHAHQRGILHRDLKPSNILLDASGQPHITDFGLAKRLQIPGDQPGPVSLTDTGAIVGTPNYMAPEQAVGKRGTITTATDVYGLGTVLYALLTGRAPFHGDTPLDALAQVKEHEPERPSAINRGLDRDLETICLKCLEKDATGRYASAEALAEDLERWLAGEPIRARPVRSRERVWRWCRRNPKLAGLTALAATLLLIITAGSVIAAWLIWWQKEQTAAALAVAKTHFHQARQAVNQMLARVGEEKLARVPQMERVRASLLQDALKFYQQFLSEYGTDPQVRSETAESYDRVGQIQELLGRHEEALAAFRQAISLLQELVAVYPEEPEYRHALAGSLNNLALQLQEARRFPEAEQTYRQALDYEEKLPADFSKMAQRRDYLANMYNNLGNLLERSGRSREAEQVYGRAFNLRQKLVEEFPKQANFLELLAQSYSNLASVQDLGKAEQGYRQALAIQEKLIAGSPTTWSTATPWLSASTTSATGLNKGSGFGRLPRPIRRPFRSRRR